MYHLAFLKNTYLLYFKYTVIINLFNHEHNQYG
jgi:hypothetical protein